MASYRVHLRSRPGFMEQYDGHVDVRAETAEAAREAALAKLRRTSFPDRGTRDWIAEGVEERTDG